MKSGFYISKISPESIHLHPRIKKPRPGNPLTIKVRRVCEKCNNGWMSRIVELSKPLVQPLINGGSVTLDHLQYRDFVNWITIMTMVAEFTDEITVSVTQAERVYFSEKNIPVSGWKYWIGATSGERWHTHYKHHGGGFVPRDPKATTSFRVQSSTFAFGGVLLHIVSHPEVCGSYRLPESCSRKMRLLWPSDGQSITLPSGDKLTDSEATELADSYFKHVFEGSRPPPAS